MSVLGTIVDMGSSIATGGLVGGILRLAPEVLKLFTSASDRAHELAMREMDIRAAKEVGEQRLREMDTAGGYAVEGQRLEALREAVKAQGRKTGIWIADALSALVRPVVTYYFCLLYGAAKAAIFIAAMSNGVAVTDAILMVWTEADAAQFFGILGFWFVGRVFENQSKR